MNNIEHYRKILERKKGERVQLKKQIRSTKSKLIDLKQSLEDNLTAQAVIHDQAKKTQAQLENHISDIVSKSMSYVFDDPYMLKIQFESKAGKISVQMDFERNGNLYSTSRGTGGGVRDITALALRFAAYTLNVPRTRPLLFLDEPLHWLKGDDLPERGGIMINKVSKRIKMQILMVSHDPDLIAGANHLINVAKIKGISRVA